MAKKLGPKKSFWTRVALLILIGLPLCYCGYLTILHTQCKKVEQQIRNAGLSLTFDELDAQYQLDRENAANDLIQAGELFEQWILDHKGSEFPDSYQNFGQDPNTDAAIIQYLAENCQVIEWLNQAKLTGACYFPLKRDGNDITLNACANMRFCAKLLVCDAIVAAWHNNPQGVIDSLDTIYSLGHYLIGQPFIINILFGNSMHRLGFNAVEQLINQNKLSPDLTRQLITQLESVYREEALHQSIASEIPFVHTSCHSTSYYTAPAWANALYYFVGGPQILFRDFARCTLEYERAARQPWPQKLEQAISVAAKYNHKKSWIEKLMRSFNDFLSSFDFTYDRLFFLDLEILLLQEMTRTALAIELYRFDHNKLPESLAGLVPTYISEIPRDFCASSETPIQYEQTPNGYKLYSVFIDGVSNDGTVNKEDRYETGNDLVLEINYTY